QTELLILVLVLGGLMLLWRERHRVFPGNWSSAALKRGNDWVLDHLDKLKLIKLPCGPTPNLNYNADEEVLCVLPGTRLMEARTVRTSQSVYGGASVRIAKGLYIRSGRRASTSEPHEKLFVIQRTLVLTSQRLVFLGGLHTTDTYLKDIVGTESYMDGVRVHRKRKVKGRILHNPGYVARGLRRWQGPGCFRFYD